MNLLLVDAAEIRDGTVTLADRRAVHLRTVIGAAVGDRVKAGIVGAGAGTAEVIADDGERLTLRLDELGPAPVPEGRGVELVLAVPRPKVLTRVIEAAAAFGVARIALTNAWRVDKSYLASPRVDAGALVEAARLGAEQGAHTHVPPIAVHARFMVMLDALGPGDGRARLVAHPGAPAIERATIAGDLVLAIGPEGGWIQREVDTFIARGFQPVSLGASVLRVETAVASALGQLALLRRQRDGAS